MIYKIVFVAIVLGGSALSADLVIDLSDTFNGLMAIPNLIGVLTLSGTVVAITKNYSKRKMKKSDPKLKPMLSYFDDVQKEQEKAMAEEEIHRV